MRILFIASYYNPIIGGAERSLQIMAKTLSKQGHDVTVHTLGIPNAPHQEELEGIKIERQKLQNIYQPHFAGPQPKYKKLFWHMIDAYNLAMANDAKNAVTRLKPDVVNTQNIAGFSSAIWSAIKSCGVPLVHTIRDQYLLCPKGTMFYNGRSCEKQCFAARLYCWPRMWATRYVDSAIGISQYILDKHLNYGCFSNSLTSVVYNPFTSTTDMQNPITQIPHYPFRFGFLGMLSPHKGIEKLLKAFQKLKPNTAELWIGGRGDKAYTEGLKRLVDGNNSVKWLGFVAPDDILSNIDVLVVPSLWQEAFGRVILEAFTFKVPVLASARGGIPESISPETGWLFDPDKPGALEACLRRCLEECASLPVMGRKAQEYARKFNCELNAEATLNVYRYVLQRKELTNANVRFP